MMPRCGIPPIDLGRGGRHSLGAGLPVRFATGPSTGNLANSRAWPTMSACTFKSHSSPAPGATPASAGDSDRFAKLFGLDPVSWTPEQLE